MHSFPEAFRSNIIGILGDKGREWLFQIPAIVESLQNKWRFCHVETLANLSYSYVGLVKLQNNSDAILKIAPPIERRRAEIDWYLANPSGTAEIFQIDPEHGAILMQRLRPGYSLKRLVEEGRDDAATRALAVAIRTLSPVVRPGQSFKLVSSLAADFDSLAGFVNATLVDRAVGVFKDLTADHPQDVPLHGDIHHDNVLSDGDRWLVIDPHGYLGPKSFEVGAMIRNPYDCFPKILSLKRTIDRRLDILNEELPFSIQEIRAWAFACTLLSVAWSVSDHAELPQENLEILEVL